MSKLRLDKNEVTLRFNVSEEEDDVELSEESEDESEHSDSSEEDGKERRAKKPPKKTCSKSASSTIVVEIDIDLTLSAHANANRLYTQKKVARSKEEKTAMATERAVKAVEEQTTKQLESQKIKRNLQAVRKVHWFEKFNWFVTSEGYLVLSGRDAQQNEALVKRYLRPGDAYVHADIHGASSCIVRCKTDQESRPIPISPFALQEAGTMTICRSGAWAVKVVTSAWWVHSSQVSKTAPTGEYLTTGSFMIYGRKNFLPPTSLEMGFGILFRLDDSSVTRHAGERKDRAVEFENESEDARSMISERYDIEMEAVADPGFSMPRSGPVPAIASAATAALPPKSSPVPDSAVGTSSKKLSAHERRLAKKAVKKDGVTNPSLLSGVQEAEDKVESEIDVGAVDVAEERPENSEISRGTQNASKQQKPGATHKVSSKMNQSKTVPESNVSNSSADKSTLEIKKKKAPNKKKARRYANQDDEDLELAMQALGHIKTGGGKTSVLKEDDADEARKLEKQRKQEKVYKYAHVSSD